MKSVLVHRVVMLSTAVVLAGAAAGALEESSAVGVPTQESTDAQSQESGAAEPQESGAAEPPERPAVDGPVAFWIHLDMPDQTMSVPITEAEWDQYVDYIRATYPVADEASFTYKVVKQFMDNRLVQMANYRSAKQVKRRAENIKRKLDEGAKWDRMVRLYTEDADSPSDGLYGSFRRILNRYPLEMHVFEAEVGDIIGPFYTTWGAEIFKINEFRGQAGTSSHQVVVSYILLKWGPTMDNITWPRLRRLARVESELPRFHRVLPPGLLREHPGTFGPTDIAPIGEPENSLSQHSSDDRFHGLRIKRKGRTP